MGVIEDSGEHRVEGHRRPLGVIDTPLPMLKFAKLVEDILPSAVIYVTSRRQRSRRRNDQPSGHQQYLVYGIHRDWPEGDGKRGSDHKEALTFANR
jgi:hypothetical protein